MPNQKKWTIGLGLATGGLLIAGLSSPAAWADSSTPGDGYTAPAPTKYDRAGTDQDQVCFQDGEFLHPQYGWGSYRIDDVPQAAGCHSTKGASSITVTTSFNSGTWTFDYTDEDHGAAAKNKYWVEVGDTCIPAGAGIKYRQVTAYFTNVADETGRYVHSIYPATSSPIGMDATRTPEAYDIADGETVGIPIMENPEERPGLTPGVWVTKFYRSDTGSAASDGHVVHTTRSLVPRCGAHSDETGQQATGHLRRLGCEAVSVRPDAQWYAATRKAAFLLTTRVEGHKAHRTLFTVPSGQRGRAFTVEKPRDARAVFTLETKPPDSTWQRLDRVTVPRCR